MGGTAGVYSGAYTARMTRLLLALDAASPQVSVALGRGDVVLAVRAEAIARSSRRLLEMVDEVLGEAGVEREALGGIVALRGPGSFTGLRVGLATALGLQMALRVPATALPTLQVLAGAARDAGEVTFSADGPVLAAVDALRAEWTIQPFASDPPRPLGEAETVAAAEIAARRPAVVVGFGVAALAATPGWPASVRLIEPGPLAPVALRLVTKLHPTWDAGLLTAPIYARPPAVTTPRQRLPSAPETART